MNGCHCCTDGHCGNCICHERVAREPAWFDDKRVCGSGPCTLPELEPTGYDSMGAALWPWQTEER